MGNTLTGYMFNRENRERIEMRERVKVEINEFKKDQQNKAVTEETKRCQNLINESWIKREPNTTYRGKAYKANSNDISNGNINGNTPENKDWPYHQVLNSSVEEELRTIIRHELDSNSYDTIINNCLENCKKICNKKDLNLLLHKIYLLRTEYGTVKE